LAPHKAADPVKCRTSRRAAALEFSRDGRFLATGSRSQSVTLYDTATRNPMELPREMTGSDPVLAISPDGSGFVTAAPGALRLWNLSSL
jgi:WD40 repeat protein